MSNTNRENAELQAQWDEEEKKDQLVRRLGVAVLVVLLAGVGFIAWMAWQMMEVVGYR